MINFGLPDHGETTISDFAVTYSQDSDTNAKQGIQDIQISSELVENEYYMILKTERWAINDIDEMIHLLEDFKSRIDLNNNTPKNT